MSSRRRKIYYDADPGYGSQTDSPGHEEFPEPHVGQYSGWMTAVIWLSAIGIFWGGAYAFIWILLR